MEDCESLNEATASSLPSKEEMAARGLEDVVDAMSLEPSWQMFGNARRRERAFTYAGGRDAELRQSRGRAAQLRRRLLRGRAPSSHTSSTETGMETCRPTAAVTQRLDLRAPSDAPFSLTSLNSSQQIPQDEGVGE